MMSLTAIYTHILQSLLKLAGMRPKPVELEPGTIVHFGVPNKPAKKPVLVFLHGFGLNGILTWQFQVLSLATTYAVYVPDFLFFGGSVTDKPDRSPEFQAECIVNGLRRLGVERCSLVGLSYGGMVGFKMAEMYPDLVKSMVVSCSVLALTESITRAGLERIGFSSWAEILIPETVQGVRDLVAVVGYYKLPSKFIPNFVCQDILQKIHLLWGEHDRIFNLEQMYNLKEELGGKATLSYIEKAGHAVQLERPFTYSTQLRKILASLHQD